MGNHVHYKNGKFNLWSTVVDAYTCHRWLPENEFRKDAVGQLLYSEIQRIMESVDVMIEKAKREGCSASVDKHEKTEI